jgi:uncharacterized protein (DUF427 family)
MVQAVWNDAVLAESDNTIVIEGNHYFPPNSINQQYFKPSDTHTLCSWKGTASYYDIEVDGRLNRDAAWYYAFPQTAAEMIADYVAFWHGVDVSEV